MDDVVVISKKLKHQNIVQFIGLFKERDLVVIVTEFPTHGSLF